MDLEHVHELLGTFAPALIALILGGTGIGMAGRIVHLVHAAQNWPTTLGIVRRSELVWSHNPGDKYHSGAWMPTIEYDYEVNGKLFTGRKISPFGDTGYSRKEWSESKIAPYAVDESVEVRYDPRNPARSCLEITSDGMLLAVIFILIGIGLGIGFCIRYFG